MSLYMYVFFEQILCYLQKAQIANLEHLHNMCGYCFITGGPQPKVGVLLESKQTLLFGEVEHSGSIPVHAY